MSNNSVFVTRIFNLAEGVLDDDKRSAEILTPSSPPPMYPNLCESLNVKSACILEYFTPDFALRVIFGTKHCK